VPRAGDDFEILSPGHPDRTSLQRFIADVYARAYGAEVCHFARTLAGLRRADGQWSGAVGYTLAGPEPLFLEQYLDQPIEAALAERLGVAVRREQIVEAGNLAASSAGAARDIIVRMAVLLNTLGRCWVALTLTGELLNSFARLDLHPIAIAQADPGRLPDGGASWGTYYACQPRVMVASIPAGYARLAAGKRFRRGL
jgi:hypothetical protein